MALAPRAYRIHPMTGDDMPPHLVIGPDRHKIEVPRIDSALVEQVEVDEDNPWYSTDGLCLFTKDGTALIRCLARVEQYAVPPSCREIEDEAFAYNTVIRQVELAEGMTRIGDRAFLGSTLESIALPASMRHVGDDAFASGKTLQTVKLNEGLAHIGDSAFADNAQLESVQVPASVEWLGNRAFAMCKKLRAHGANKTLSVHADNAAYFIDDAGVLYNRADKGLVLVEALDQVRGTYRVLDGTVRIRGRAFSHNHRLEAVEFPDTLRSIGKRAFVECESLTSAELPDGLESIGAEAFYHSSLRHIKLPASLENLGAASLVVSIKIASHTTEEFAVGGRGTRDFYQTTLSGRLNEVTVPRFDVEVSPDNKKYSLEEGFLCEWPGDGGPLQAVQFVGTGTVAAVPHDVTNISAYALFGVDHLRVLQLHMGIKHIGHSALSVSYPLDLIEVDDGEETPIRLYPAQNSSGTMAQRKAFRAGTLDLNQLVRDCDASLSFMTPSDERTKRMLFRLANGRMLTEAREHEFNNTVRICLDALVREFARTNDLDSTRSLLDLGFINADNIAHAIEVANSVDGVTCARLLLEEKRRRFSAPLFDFDL